jgi:hypothetical protein
VFTLRLPGMPADGAGEQASGGGDGTPAPDAQPLNIT